MHGDLSRFRKRKNTNGYFWVYYPSHPAAFSCGMIYLHRLVAENTLGRFLKPEEQIHHIDENRTNNEPENIKVLIATEHTWIHKGKIEPRPCELCGKLFKGPSRQQYCTPECSARSFRRAERPDKKELRKLVWSVPTVHIAKSFGVSDSAVAKWCKQYGVKKPPRGYWRKQRALGKLG